MERKKVLLLCAGHNDLGTIKALKKLGMYIIVSGYTKDLIGEKYADEYIAGDYSDKEKMLAIAKEHKVDAVCQCCNDFGVYTATYVAEKLNLSGYDSYETALLLHNKEKFKEFAQSLSLPIPDFVSFSSQEEAEEWGKKATFPVIVKPSDYFGGRGTSKVESLAELPEAVAYAFGESRNKVILIEAFIQGTQHGFCTFLKDEKVVALATNDEHSFLNPYRVEIDTFPSTSDKKNEKDLIAVVEKIASTLHLVDGIFHMQYIEQEGKPYIIEVMRRILGNLYFLPASLLTNFPWEYWEARVNCGLSCGNLETQIGQEGFYAYKTVVATQNGVIEKLEIPSHYDKYLIDSLFLMKTGEEITDYTTQPIGFLFFLFASGEEMSRVLIENYQNDIVTVKGENKDE